VFVGGKQQPQRVLAGRSSSVPVCPLPKWRCESSNGIFSVTLLGMARFTRMWWWPVPSSLTPAGATPMPRTAKSTANGERTA
jgi:hypothetical protein